MRMQADRFDELMRDITLLNHVAKNEIIKVDAYDATPIRPSDPCEYVGYELTFVKQASDPIIYLPVRFYEEKEIQNILRSVSRINVCSSDISLLFVRDVCHGLPNGHESLYLIHTKTPSAQEDGANIVEVLQEFLRRCLRQENGIKIT